MLNYVLRPLPYDVSFNPFVAPIEVDLFLGYVKALPTFPPAASDVAVLFQAGATSAAPIGQLRDLISVVNTDYWTIKKRWRHKIGYANNQGTGGLVQQQYNSNNDFKLNVVKRMDITKMLPSLVQFNDGATTPTTRNLYFFQQAVQANGTISGATTLTCGIDFWIDFHYEDA